MDKKFFFIFFVTVFSQAKVQAQEFKWKLGFDYFFDNTEYAKSSFTSSETLTGIWINPSVSILWDKVHSINAGVNLLKIPGMDKAVDKTEVTMYYQYKTPKVLFRAGAFPRNELLQNYNTFFFKDSVNHFIPLMQGVFWQIGNEKNFFNLWMDWTGYATPKIHETFFLGFSGKLSKGLFFADFQSYMFHHSLTKPSIEGEGVNENLQLQISTGVEYLQEDGFKGLVSIGTLAGYERDRRPDGQLYKPIGFTAQANAEYWGIGVKNTLYVGDARMRLAETFGGNLYWGTQFLRDKKYLKSEWYIRLIESQRVKARFNCNVHITEGHLLFQQMLTLSASINNCSSKGERKIDYPWMKFFK